MYEPFDPATWTEFYFTVAAASAALIGLIVVGLSIHAAYIARSVTHRSHARATLIVLTATMVIGLLDNGLHVIGGECAVFDDALRDDLPSLMEGQSLQGAENGVTLVGRGALAGRFGIADGAEDALHDGG